MITNKMKKNYIKIFSLAALLACTKPGLTKANNLAEVVGSGEIPNEKRILTTLHKADIYRENGDPYKANKLYQEVFSNMPGSDKGYFSMGEALIYGICLYAKINLIDSRIRQARESGNPRVDENQLIKVMKAYYDALKEVGLPSLLMGKAEKTISSYQP